MELEIENGQVVENIIPPIVEFYEHPRKVGIAKYEPTVYIKLRNHLVKDVMSRRATDEDKREYSEAWEKYQSGLSQAVEGTPLQQLPAFKAAFGMELGAIGITTVEALSYLEMPKDEYLIPMWRQARRFIQLENEEDEGQYQEIQREAG